MFKSIRWQLPLSYAAIALLAALALGAVLLTTLRSYYLRQELDYLTNNARGLSVEMARMVQAGLPPKAVQAQLDNFSFLSQARVRLLDAAGQPLADSGEPQEQPQVAALSVEVEANNAVPANVFTHPITGTLVEPIPGKEYASFIYIQRPDFEIVPSDMIITRTLMITRTGGEADIFHWQIGQLATGTQVITAEMGEGVVRLAELPGELPSPPDFISIMPAVSAPRKVFSSRYGLQG